MSARRDGVIAGLLVVMASVSSCAPVAPLQKRWGTLTDPAESAGFSKPTLWIGPFSVDATSFSTKDLSDHGQAAYIQAQAMLSKGDADALRASIAKSISTSKPLLDTTSLDRTLLITVGKDGFYPADRLVRTELTLTPVGFKFANLVAAATTYSTISVETVSATNSTTAGFEWGPSVAGTAKITGGTTRSASDQATISQQIEQLTLYKSGDNLVVYRESERGIDLTGNTLLRIGLQNLTVDGRFDPYVVTEAKLIDDKGRWRPPGDASLTIAKARYVKPQSYSVHATLKYIVRHVTKGQDTYDESDDVVTYIKNELQGDYELVAPPELRVSRWQLRQGEASLCVSNVVDAGGTMHPFEFTDFQTAQAMQNWLRARGGPFIGARRLALVRSGNAGVELPDHADLELKEVQQ